jgi:hypothetical protein
MDGWNAPNEPDKLQGVTPCVKSTEPKMAPTAFASCSNEKAAAEELPKTCAAVGTARGT